MLPQPHQASFPRIPQGSPQFAMPSELAAGCINACWPISSTTIVKNPANRPSLNLGLVFLEKVVVTPLEFERLVIIFLANDLVTTSIASDSARSLAPNHWSVTTLVETSFVVASAWLIYSFGISTSSIMAGLSLHRVHALDFGGLIFSGFSSVPMLPEHGHLWYSRPGTLLLIARAADVCTATLIWVLVRDKIRVPLPRSPGHLFPTPALQA